jgi:serine/threonine protein kinase
MGYLVLCKIKTDFSKTFEEVFKMEDKRKKLKEFDEKVGVKMEEKIVGKNYKITQKLGKGSYNEIWKAINIKSKKEYAVKFEDMSNKHQQLYSECRIYLYMQDLHSKAKLKTVLAQPVPQVVHYGPEGNKNMMIMDLLGPSLGDLFTQCNKTIFIKNCINVSRSND